MLWVATVRTRKSHTCNNEDAQHLQTANELHSSENCALAVSRRKCLYVTEVVEAAGLVKDTVSH